MRLPSRQCIDRGRTRDVYRRAMLASVSSASFGMHASLFSPLRFQTLASDLAFSSSPSFLFHRLPPAFLFLHPHRAFSPPRCQLSLASSSHRFRHALPLSFPGPDSPFRPPRPPLSLLKPPRSRPLASFVDEAGVPIRKKPIKTRTIYVCENCGESYVKWWGKCNSCKRLSTLRKFSERLTDGGGGGGAGFRAAEGLELPSSNTEEIQSENNVAEGKKYSSSRAAWFKTAFLIGPQRLSDVSKGISESNWRLPLLGGIGKEFTRVLGGGLVPGSLVLVGGDPGVGKSTLLLQVLSILADGCEVYKPAPVLYVSGEESEEQICSRADRINIASHEIFLYSAADLEVILSSIHQLRPRAVVIDSIQTVYLPEAGGSAGSVIQVRECAAALLRCAKRTQIPIFLVGHVTKSGDIAGPRVLEHIVDVVLYLEGETRLSHRLLRVVKNRFGSTEEVGVFEMIETGLIPVENPSKLFVAQRTEAMNFPAFGAIAVTMEGSRPFLVEIQALCSGNTSQTFKRTVNGLDPQRLLLILAVLTKVAGVKVQNQDVLINVVGGLQVREPAADLAVAVAICSSYFDKQIPADMAFVGEIGLGGEIRSVGQLEKRILEVGKLGFQKCVIPQSAEKALRSCTGDSVTLIPCTTIQDVIHRIVLPIPSIRSELVSAI